MLNSPVKFKKYFLELLVFGNFNENKIGAVKCFLRKFSKITFAILFATFLILNKL